MSSHNSKEFKHLIREVKERGFLIEETSNGIKFTPPPGIAMNMMNIFRSGDSKCMGKKTSQWSQKKEDEKKSIRSSEVKKRDINKKGIKTSFPKALLLKKNEDSSSLVKDIKERRNGIYIAHYGIKGYHPARRYFLKVFGIKV